MKDEKRKNSKKEEKKGKSVFKSRRFWGQVLLVIAGGLYLFEPFPGSKIAAFICWVVGQIIAIIGGAKADEPWSFKKTLDDIKKMIKKEGKSK